MYDFVTRVDRKNTGSSKWNAMYAECPETPDGVVPLSVADMEFVKPPELVECLHTMADEAILGYVRPTDDYYNAVISWQTRRHGWTPQREQIATCPGVVPALYRAVSLFSEPGDGVIIMPPVYFPFKSAAESAGRHMVENPLIRHEDGTYAIDFDDLEAKAADPANKIILTCSPHNPVGRVWSAEELRRVADICLAHDVYMVCDEIHNDLILPGHEFVTLGTVLSEDEFTHTMVCTAPSKTFNLAGVQCSNIFFGDPERHDAFTKYAFRAGGPFSLNAFAYPLCTCAYEKCAGWVDELVQVLDANQKLVREYLAAELPQITMAPLEGTYLAWLDCSGLGMDDDELDAFMTKKAYIFGDKGTLFGTGGSGFDRLNLACPTAVVQEALERLSAAVKAL